MTYESSQSGRVENVPSNSGRVEDEAGFWDYEAVRLRLVDAIEAWWRTPAPDARFKIGGRISSIWSNYVPEPALIDRVKDEDAPNDDLRPLPLSRGDMARRDEASEWILFIPERDRRIVCEGLAYLAKGHKQVPWLKLWKRLGRGKPGPDGLRKRFDRAITDVCHALNRSAPC